MIAASLNNGARDTWIDALGSSYTVHKVIWMVVAVGMVIWARNLLKANVSKQVRFFVIVILGSLFAEILFGMLLSYLSLPPVLQPLHLLLATVMFAAQFAVLINLLGVERVFRSRASRDEIEKRHLLNAE